MLNKVFISCSVCHGEKEIEIIDENGTKILDDCKKCEGCGYCEINVDENKIVFVNAYKVTRHYGDAEEGGWWYNQFDCLESVPCKNKHSDTMQDELLKQYNHIIHGNIYSVLGGTDLCVMIELKPCQSETKEKPIYE